MITFSVTSNVKALTDLQTRLSDAQMTQTLSAVGAKVGVAAESFVSSYPAPSGKPLAVFYERVDKSGKTYRSKFKTAKQQGKVFSLINQGKIPYKRTGLLGRSITSRVVEATPQSVSVAVGTNVDYARYVIGTPSEGQSQYHVGTWSPLAEDIQKHSEELAQVAQAELTRQLTGILR